MIDPERGDEAPWEVAEFLPAHAQEDIPWDRPAESQWPEPELDALAWNERWNPAAYDPDYPLPPTVARVPVAAVAAGSATGVRARFGRPIRSPEDVELDDPYDEYAPVADDLQAPGQLTWTGGTVPLRPTASLDGPAPDQPPPAGPEPPYRPSVEPPTWSRSSRSVFGDYFAGSGRRTPSLPTANRPTPSGPAAAAQTSPAPEPRLTLVNEYPPVPTDFKPRWASVAPVRPAWPEPVRVVPTRATLSEPGELPPTWVVSSPAPAQPAAARLPAPPPPAPMPAGAVVSAAGVPASRPLPAVRTVVPPPVIRRPPDPILADDYDQPAVALGAEPAADVEEGGPSTVSTLFWMAVTGVVVVGLVLAFLHFMTGLFR